MWNVEKAVKHLTFHVESESTGYCVRYVKKAISAGGEIEAWSNIESAKDYVQALIEALNSYQQIKDLLEGMCNYTGGKNSFL